MMKIYEINIQLIKPTNSLVTFARVILDDKIYLGSIDVHQRLEECDFLEKILSNRVFDYPTVRYEKKKPFQTVSRMASSSNWLRLVDTVRTEYVREVLEFTPFVGKIRELLGQQAA